MPVSPRSVTYQLWALIPVAASSTSRPQPTPKIGDERNASTPPSQAPVRSELSPSCETRPPWARLGSAAKRTSAKNGHAIRVARSIEPIARKPALRPRVNARVTIPATSATNAPRERVRISPTPANEDTAIVTALIHVERAMTAQARPSVVAMAR